MEEIANAYGSKTLYPTAIRCLKNEPIMNDTNPLPTISPQHNNNTQPTELKLNILNPTDDPVSNKAMARLIQSKWTLATNIPTNVRMHIDGGANRSITNDRSHLIRYRNIKKYPMSGVAADEPALVCTGMGYLPWQADNGEVVLVRCYYSERAAETIVSPNDIVTNHIQDFVSWGQYSNMDTGTGRLEFHRRSNAPPLTFNLRSSNGLWYYNNNNDHDDYTTWTARCIHGEQPVIRRMSKLGEYVLYHFRYGCAGERDLLGVHHRVDNQPKLSKHAFFKCPTCCTFTSDMQMPETVDASNIPAEVCDWLDDNIPEAEKSCLPGQHYHIDFGFMKGSGYCQKDEEGRTITSIDGYRSYFLIIDRSTRYTWVFLTKTRHPPIKIFEQFLKEHGHPTAHHRTIRCDKGGELWGSQAFRQLLANAGYIIEPTAPNAPFQNGKAERPNKTFGRMVNSLLYNAGLGPEYWSFALLHAVYLKNRRIHRATNQVPITQYTGKRPDARRLRIFGSPVIVRNLGSKTAKLDIHTTAGKFLGYTATDKNIIYIDSVTKRVKTATHVVFDEAGMTIPASELSPSAKMLQQLGYAKDHDEDGTINLETASSGDAIPESLQTLTQPVQHAESLPTNETQLVQHNPTTPIADIQIKCLSDRAKLPTRATDASVGYDLYSATNITIQPNTRERIPLDLQIIPPCGTYGQIFSRSGLAAKHCVDVCAGTIDPDYTGNVQVLLANNGNNEFVVNIGDRIA